MVSTTTVRVSKDTHRRLQELARESGVTMPELVDRLVEADRRRRLFDRANEAYAALQADPAAWEEELGERRAWDAALADGLSADDSTSTEQDRGAAMESA
jgi:predicted transcriptional regulator